MHDMSGASIVEIEDVCHRYGGILALDGVSAKIDRGSFSAILGANGAGKSTFACVLTGLIKPTSGRVHFSPLDGSGLAPKHCLVPEGRRLFAQLTIEENLKLAGYGAGARGIEIEHRYKQTLDAMPDSIRSRTGEMAGVLSGGERQMVAVGRALMAKPDMIVVDEPSLGLAPILIEKVYKLLAGLNAQGVSIVVVEQLATHALAYCDSILVMQKGQIIYHGPSTKPEAQAALRAGYVG